MLGLKKSMENDGCHDQLNQIQSNRNPMEPAETLFRFGDSAKLVIACRIDPRHQSLARKNGDRRDRESQRAGLGM